ncbi:uncharacterized protein BXZ73DRAFT_101368 [Epithele typhae]|uniref:uncharacterized protein n=1 Tax=Epithele typhae TaxID=378194 RepID=UPI002007AAE1|nr:uncharacterized protein BXZ73DRAFT_101368 [Epithele typhae]KAH9932834.1 hypothetical protein BXZ73DRAFT_101368 [Epithele typhae]
MDTLPEEIFLFVCRMLAPIPLLSIDPDENGEEDEYLRPLLHLTHVCRSWRRTLIDAQSMWSYLILKPSDNVCKNISSVFMERSGESPLTIIIVTNDIDDVHRTISAQGRRLFHFQIRMLAPSPAHYSLLFPSATPLLETLSIKYETDAPNETEYRKLNPWSTRMFHDGPSSLRALQLWPVQYDLPLDSFPILTHLFLSLDSVNVECGTLFEDVLSLLARTPLLQFFNLHYIQTNGNSLPASERNLPAMVKLSRLNRMSVSHTNWEFIGNLLRRLILPLEFNICFTDPPSEGAFNDWKSCASRIVNLLCRTAIPSLERLKICQSRRQVTITAEGPLSQAPPPRAHGRLALSTGLPGPGDAPRRRRAHAVSWLASLPTHIPFSSIRVLHLDVEHNPVPLLSSLLAHAPALATLVFLFRAHHGTTKTDELAALDALTAALLVPAADGALPCPQLATLGSWIWFPGLVANRGSTGDARRALVAATFAKFAALATARARLGRPLRTLLLAPITLPERLRPEELQEAAREDGEDGRFGEVLVAAMVEAGIETLRGVVDEVVWAPDGEGRVELDRLFATDTAAADEEDLGRAGRYWRIPRGPGA